MKEHNVYEGQRDGLFDGPHLSGEGQALAADALALDRMEDLPDGVQEHLGECQECREAVIEVYQILRDTDSLPEEGDHPFFSRGEAVEEPLKPAGRRWLKYAAIALLILLPGSMLILRAPLWEQASFSRWLSGIFGGDRHDPFAPSPELEPLAGMVFRDPALQVLVPLPGDTLGMDQPLILNYLGLEGQTLLLELLDNRGVVLGKSMTGDGKAQLQPPGSQGLYYWKLSRDGHLLYLGKVCWINHVHPT